MEPTLVGKSAKFGFFLVSHSILSLQNIDIQVNVPTFLSSMYIATDF